VQFYNEILDKGGVKDLIAQSMTFAVLKLPLWCADRVKDIGFEYAMRSVATIAVADISIPETKPEISGRIHPRSRRRDAFLAAGFVDRTRKR
jgi:DNA-directed RNA polymerase subunit beta'